MALSVKTLTCCLKFATSTQLLLNPEINMRTMPVESTVYGVPSAENLSKQQHTPSLNKQCKAHLLHVIMHIVYHGYVSQYMSHGISVHIMYSEKCGRQSSNSKTNVKPHRHCTLPDELWTNQFANWLTCGLDDSQSRQVVGIFGQNVTENWDYKY